ncbi:MAG: hypothetical protein SV186_00035 [Candidatus Nanohaloarchaea archaeon]|nr:hypothetical protein [Candidatus Nanohaloarchaea archaeon]
MVTFLPAFRTGLTVAGIVGTLAAFWFYRLLTRQPERAMVMFQLQPEKAQTDFRLLLGLEIVAVAGLVPYLWGAVTENMAVMNLGRATSMLIGVTLLVLFYRWGRRFR